MSTGVEVLLSGGGGGGMIDTMGVTVILAWPRTSLSWSQNMLTRTKKVPGVCALRLNSTLATAPGKTSFLWKKNH